MSKLNSSLVLFIGFLLLCPILLDSPKQSSGNRTARSHSNSHPTQKAIFHNFQTDSAFSHMENLNIKTLLPNLQEPPKAHEGKQELAQPSHTTGRASNTGRDTVFSQSCFRKHPAVWFKELHGCSARGQRLPLKIPAHGEKGQGVRPTARSKASLPTSSTTHQHTI